jgi:flavin reductase (DIM6/NTAB) family NADH-FMN oxidoreductase RutF
MADIGTVPGLTASEGKGSRTGLAATSLWSTSHAPAEITAAVVKSKAASAAVANPGFIGANSCNANLHKITCGTPAINCRIAAAAD